MAVSFQSGDWFLPGFTSHVHGLTVSASHANRAARRVEPVFALLMEAVAIAAHRLHDMRVVSSSGNLVAQAFDMRVNRFRLG